MEAQKLESIDSGNAYIKPNDENYSNVEPERRSSIKQPNGKTKRISFLEPILATFYSEDDEQSYEVTNPEPNKNEHKQTSSIPESSDGAWANPEDITQTFDKVGEAIAGVLFNVFETDASEKKP